MCSYACSNKLRRTGGWSSGPRPINNTDMMSVRADGDLILPMRMLVMMWSRVSRCGFVVDHRFDSPSRMVSGFSPSISWKDALLRQSMRLFRLLSASSNRARQLSVPLATALRVSSSFRLISTLYSISSLSSFPVSTYSLARLTNSSHWSGVEGSHWLRMSEL